MSTTARRGGAVAFANVLLACCLTPAVITLACQVEPSYNPSVLRLSSGTGSVSRRSPLGWL